MLSAARNAVVAKRRAPVRNMLELKIQDRAQVKGLVNWRREPPRSRCSRKVKKLADGVIALTD